MTTERTVATPVAAERRRDRLRMDRWRRVGSQAALMAVAMTVANALSYVLAVAAARQLGPAEYGVLAPLLGVLVIASVAPVALQVVTTRRWSAVGDPVDQQRMARTAAWTAVLVGFLTVALAVPLTSFLHLPSVTPVWLLAVVAVPLTWVGYLQGRALGHERFGRVAAVVAVVAVGKVGGGLAGLALRPDVTGVMAGTAGGAIVAVALSAWLTQADRPVTRGGRPGGPSGAAREVVHAGHALLALMVLVNADLLLARHFLSAELAGQFAAGAILTKIAFWMPQFISVVALPRLVDARRRDVARRAALIATAAGGVALVGVVAAFDGPLVELLAGPEYLIIAPYAWIFALEGTVFALAQVLLYARLARGDRQAVGAVWLAGAALAVGVSLHHDSPQQIAAVAAVVAGLLVAAGLLLDARRTDGQSTAPGHGPGW